jgi:cyclic pyranopterin phosphate synthase
MASSVPSTRLIDRFGRVHTSLRLSVTDRCNIRCFYCMPEVDAKFVDKSRLLSFEELERLARLLVQRCGIRDIRLTGGEPLVRRQLDRLIGLLAAIDGLEDLSLTTNGILLAEQAGPLRDAGLKRINISLDTLDEDVFHRISRRSGLEKTIAGIDRAIGCGFESIKLNALAIRGITEGEVCRLVEFALQRGVTIRFIEFMPLDADRAWRTEDVLDGDTLLSIIEQRFGTVTPVQREDPSQPAEEFLVDSGRLGIIRSVTAPFCDRCNRLRITADGSVRNCLFATTETPLRERIRNGASDEELIEAIQTCIAAKAAAHGIDRDGFEPPERPMYAIGG